MLPLEFVVFGIPISAQAKHGSTSKRRWMAAVEAEERAAAPSGTSPVGHNVLVQVVYYYTGVPLGVDNMMKPILDAMKGAVYADDRLVTDIQAAKRDLGEDFLLDRASEALASALRSRGDFVHVRVEIAPDPRHLP